MFGALLLLLIVVAIVAAWVVATRNDLVRRVNLVAESWRQVDVELQRRYELIPNLVQVVEAYAQYERALLTSLTAARANAMSQQALPQRAGAEDALGQNVRQVLVRAEAYPQLKASSQFLALQCELVDTEDRIAAGLRLYNGNVRALDTKCQTFPASVVANSMHVQQAEYFEADDPAVRAVVQIPPGLGN
ncbi:MAG: LemA family protein [Micrococcales bacterium]|nr:LemA family protein [Micrococcales bacterium]